jgi:glycosyltransferase involved in cell wall biosynthesis
VNHVHGLVSIILPTYNREAFLPDAVDAIRRQSFTDYELIAVDDGSTDNTREVLGDLSTELRQPFVYLSQENQGAYAARAHGVREASGEYIAFYDSDDLWLPHHLQKCVEALHANGEVDWLYAAAKRVDAETGSTLEGNTFYEDGRPREFMKLSTRNVGGLRIIDDPRTVKIAIAHGLRCGIQRSVLRKRVFDRVRFRTDIRNGEDRLFVIRAAKKGCCFGYFDEVHLIYRVHANNMSAVGRHRSLSHRVSVYENLTRGYEDLETELDLSRKEQRALRRQLARQYFWQLGYSVLWLDGERRAALGMFRRGLGFWHWNPRMWKTFLLAQLKFRLGLS